MSDMAMDWIGFDWTEKKDWPKSWLRAFLLVCTVRNRANEHQAAGCYLLVRKRKNVSVQCAGWLAKSRSKAMSCLSANKPDNMAAGTAPSILYVSLRQVKSHCSV